MIHINGHSSRMFKTKQYTRIVTTFLPGRILDGFRSRFLFLSSLLPFLVVSVEESESGFISEGCYEANDDVSRALRTYNATGTGASFTN